MVGIASPLRPVSKDEAFQLGGRRASRPVLLTWTAWCVVRPRARLHESAEAERSRRIQTRWRW
jgi:hypothetical protein